MNKPGRKLLPLLLLALAAAGTAACDGTVTEITGDGIEAVWAGKPWAGDASARLVGAAGDTLLLVGSTPPGSGAMAAAYVRVSAPVRGVGSYPLGPGDAELTYLIGGDVRTAAYATTRAEAGVLTVRELGAGWVSGTVTFDATASFGSAPVGPTATFSGNYRARVERLR